MAGEGGLLAFSVQGPGMLVPGSLQNSLAQLRTDWPKMQVANPSELTQCILL